MDFLQPRLGCGPQEERSYPVMFSVRHKAPGTRGPVGEGHHEGQQRKCPELMHSHPMVMTTVTASSLLPGLAPGRGPPRPACHQRQNPACLQARHFRRLFLPESEGRTGWGHLSLSSEGLPPKIGLSSCVQGSATGPAGKCMFPRQTEHLEAPAGHTLMGQATAKSHWSRDDTWPVLPHDSCPFH